jgi:soluble lytic murein transglycosylase-like protein
MSLPTSKYRALFDAGAELVGLPAWKDYTSGEWLEALCMTESSGAPHATHMDQPDAVHTSYGLFQIEGATAQMLRPGLLTFESLFLPIQNMALALELLCQNFTQYGSIEKALAAYNGGSWGAGSTTDGLLNDQAYVNRVQVNCAKVRADRGGA